jgi:hypothetical protein
MAQVHRNRPRLLSSLIGAQVFEEVVEVPLFAWAVITVLGAVVWASSLIDKHVPIWVILAFAYASSAIAAYMYVKLKWIRNQLSPRPMTKEIMHLVDVGRDSNGGAAHVTFAEAVGINIAKGNHAHAGSNHAHTGSKSPVAHTGPAETARTPLLLSPRTEVSLEGGAIDGAQSLPTALERANTVSRHRSVSSVHSSIESQLLGKHIGLGWHEPLYLLRPPPDGKLKRPSRQYQLYPFGAHGVHLMNRVSYAKRIAAAG